MLAYYGLCVEGVDLVKRQALLCHRVLRAIEAVAKESSILTRDTWETLLKFLLAANDSLLSPPTEKGLTLTLFFSFSFVFILYPSTLIFSH